VFSFSYQKENTFLRWKLLFLFTGINFPLTNFLYGYQTWENEENGFQEFVFLETNKALAYIWKENSISLSLTRARAHTQTNLLKSDVVTTTTTKTDSYQPPPFSPTMVIVPCQKKKD
jgi:hypothetical protein